MHVTLLIAVLVVASLVLCAAARQSEPQSEPQEHAAPPLPPEAKRLEAWVGTWEAEVSMMGQTTKGTETCRIECGGHWLVTEHAGSFMGVPFQGKGFTGWDATKSAYAGVWIDSTGGPMAVLVNGRFSKDGKRFTSEADGVGMDGRPARFEYVTTFPDARTRTFEVFRVDGDERESQMRIAYVKR